MSAGSVTLVEERAEAGATRFASTRVRPLLGATLQLGLIVLLIRQFQLETRTFYQLALLTLGGFVVHALLPLRYRLPFFLLLSLGGIGLTFGASGLWIVGVVGVFVGVAHLPLRWSARVALLVLAGVALVPVRAGWVPSPIPSAAWPILASMLMVRLAVYLYDREHSDVPFNLSRSLSYFLLLPNVCFPFFPVVDYKTFERKYYDEEAHRIYQRGLAWMVRGLIQLLLYRFVYLHLTLDPADVTGLGDVARYAATSFLLYLRITGQFHLIVGMLLLFGFNLPETNHRYLLSSSFTDLWRRANIYWKDCMLKLVYYPCFFRLRRRVSNLTALTLGMVMVMLVTYLLHAYQWFWLRGDPLFTAQDILFWLLLGTLVVLTAVWDARQGAKRVVGGGKQGWSLRRGLATLATFATLSLLWSLWSSTSVGEWLGVLSAGRHVSLHDAFWLLGAGAAGVAVAGWNWEPNPLDPRRSADGLYQRQLLQTTGLLAGLIVLGQPAVYQRLRPSLSESVASVREPVLSRQDQAELTRGYYENLGNVGHFNIRNWDAKDQKPSYWNSLAEVGAARKRDDFVVRDLRPSLRVTYKGQPFSVNQWGMRDRDYSLEKPSGTYRIAMLGPSDVMGYGVADGETFETVLEGLLNQGTAAHYEVLNFGIEDHSLLQQAAVLDERGLQFHPDVVMVTVHEQDELFLARHLAVCLERRYAIPYEPVRAILARAGLDSTSRLPVVTRALKPYTEELTGWALAHIAEQVKATGGRLVLTVMWLPTERPDHAVDGTMRRAAELGYTVLNLGDVYRGYDGYALRFGQWDHHPNATGHRIIAERLLRELVAHDSALQMGLADGRDPVHPDTTGE